MRSTDATLTNAEIARRLGVSPEHLNKLINQAVREGWLKFDDPMARVEHELIPKTLDNLALYLNQGDKQVTLETAKGTIFPAFREAKGISDAPKTVLALKIELPDGTSSTAVSGHIVGSPRRLSDENEPQP